jgi:hypothetical protein
MLHRSVRTRADPKIEEKGTAMKKKSDQSNDDDNDGGGDILPAEGG